MWAPSKQAHVAHQKDLPQEGGEGGGKKKGRREAEQMKRLVMRVERAVRRWWWEGNKEDGLVSWRRAGNKVGQRHAGKRSGWDIFSKIIKKKTQNKKNDKPGSSRTTREKYFQKPKPGADTCLQQPHNVPQLPPFMMTWLSRTHHWLTWSVDQIKRARHLKVKKKC